MRQISSSSLDAKVNRASGPPALNEQHVLVLREIVAEHPRCRRWMQSRRCCTGAAPSECAAWRCTERWLPQESCGSSRLAGLRPPSPQRARSTTATRRHTVALNVTGAVTAAVSPMLNGP